MPCMEKDKTLRYNKRALQLSFRICQIQPISDVAAITYDINVFHVDYFLGSMKIFHNKFFKKSNNP